MLVMLEVLMSRLLSLFLSLASSSSSLFEQPLAFMCMFETRHARTLKPSVRGFCSVEQGRYIFMGFDVALFSCVYFWGCGYCALFELLRTASIGWGLPLLVADLAYICYAAPALLVHFFIFCVIIFLALLLLIINLLLIVRLLYARW